MQHIPMSYLGVQYVQHVAVMAEPMYELMKAVRSREFDAVLPRIPTPETWRELYRDHRAITRGVADGMPDLWGMDGGQTQDLLDESRALSLEEKTNPGAISKPMLREYGPSYLQRVFRVGLWQVERDYKYHLRDLRGELHGVTVQAQADALDAALSDQPAVCFYARVVLPAILLMRTTRSACCVRLGLRSAQPSVSKQSKIWCGWIPWQFLWMRSRLGSMPTPARFA